jgi:hypothetical protein
MLTKLELTLDCANATALAGFWKRAVGYVDAPQPAPLGVAWLVDPRGVAPSLCLLEVPEPKTVKNRLHVDLVVSGDGAPDEHWQRVTGEVARLRAAGATLLAEYTGHHVVLADPEGNEFCVT